MTFMEMIIKGLETLDGIDKHIEKWIEEYKDSTTLSDYLGIREKVSEEALLERFNSQSKLQQILETPISALYA